MKILFSGEATFHRSQIKTKSQGSTESRPAKFIFALAVILFLVVTATAQTTNGLSDAEIQGQQLVQRLLEQTPATNFTQIGILKIQKNGESTNLYLTITTKVNSDDYIVDYNATNSNGLRVEWLKIIFTTKHGNIYYTSQHVLGGAESNIFDARLLRGNGTMVSFANSDFWICDLGLEFFHWPEQKIIKKEFARGRGCMVLESTNPDPSPNGYSRVDCWIDEETLGIVQAKAYDARGKLLKEFQPKSFKKVNGQWELQDMEIRNVQTGSRTQIKFNLETPNTEHPTSNVQ